MGTRGAIGFRINETDKVTYNHWDSYPTGMGVNVAEAIRKFNDEKLAGAAARIVLVEEDSTPTAEQMERYRAFHNGNVSTGKPTEWYALLREVQGELVPFVDGTIDHMINHHGFLGDSLFCEWAYVLNCDTHTLEIYRGFNKNPDAAGRYAGTATSGDGYAGVTLLSELPFDEVRAWADPLAELKAIEEAAYAAEGDDD